MEERGRLSGTLREGREGRRGRLGGWVRSLGERWRGWRRRRGGQGQEPEVVVVVRGKEEEDTQSENDSAYESLPGSARSDEEGERNLSRASLSSEEAEGRREGWRGRNEEPVSIIKPPLLGEGGRGGQLQPKKKVSFPEVSEETVRGREGRGERLVRVRAPRLKGEWVERSVRLRASRDRGEADERVLRVRAPRERGESESESEERMRGDREGRRVRGVRKEKEVVRREKEVTRCHSGRQSVAEQVEKIREETRVWLHGTFPG